MFADLVTAATAVSAVADSALAQRSGDRLPRFGATPEGQGDGHRGRDQHHGQGEESS